MPETLALVGSETLMGRELRDILATNSLGADLQLIAGTKEVAGILSEQSGEPAVLTALEKGVLDDADAVILAGDVLSSQTALSFASDRPLIDLTYALEDNPRSRLRAPLVEPYGFHVPPDAIHSVAHPAAIALALLLGRIDVQYRLSCWIVHVFEPASERGAPGVEELQQQTVSLLSFKPMEKKIFDSQLTYNLLARVGDEAPFQLDEIESRIERHLATLLENAGQSPMPSLRVVQAPVFHGHTFSIWAEFDGPAPDVSAIEALLATEDISVHTRDVDPPSNAGIAGQNGISVGAISRDRNNPRALWFWMVSDNLRLAAQNAVRVAQELV